ncbi:hypothetical protein TGGT1_297670 [Toxoplasma gondii GT1]|uniref:DUF4200 domain-containing protein n=4 Tax=Toxoplasma gondii TaxID=5811 RepID=S7VZE9_TOXGG|nr:hypothetical protein TGGT1_297670 [Toxoplasma gondii GT1]KAF4645759.1 hypothetical protein TGRH88_002450 [Toxoplasma gondii]KFG39957.1 coiled-coil 38,related protein [Toxoplasma gondii FOU]RQX67403.1 coiled-coil 38,related protein [Toxoplasma gondii CAST]
MAVETRKAEILKLHGKVARREEALRAADQQLTKEMQKFDEFLRATDQRAHMAMKEADEVGRIKMEKQQTIRELHERLSALNARISKYEEIVQEGKMYKSFLDKLSPPAWIEEQEKKKQERIAIKRKEWAEKQLKLQQERIQKEVKDIDSETFEKISELEEKKRKAGKSFDEDGEDDDGELPMYFTEPGQLLELFRQLEEQNLFLIQNAQENEAALEDVLGKFEETKQQMEKRTGAIDSLIRQLQDQVKTQQQICGNLQTTLQKKKSEREEKMIFQQLTNKIGEVHAICGYEGDDANDAIRKLEQIEAKMEEYLAILDRYEGFLEAVTRAHTAATRKADNV